MRKILLALIIASLCIGIVSAQTDIFHKTGKRGSDINVTSVDARVVYTHPNGMRIDQRVYVDGAPMVVNFNSQSAKKETWGTGNGQGNSDVLVEHDFDNAVNDTLKCTITLKNPHEIYYPYTVQNGVSLVNGDNGNLKFVRDATGSSTDKYKPGVVVLAPVAWNKTGGAVPVWYTFTSTQINLNINDAGQEYPITIDPTLIPDIPLGYQNVTSFTYNITTGMGTQTDYQIKFILSNSSGVSGTYSGENIIYTNGTTRADWYDVNATDGSSNPLKFWIENNTQTAKNATAWVKVPTISTANSSTGKWYYGNSSQNGSTMDGLNTFPLWFDAGTLSAINTTEWKASGTGSETITNAGAANAAFNITGGSSAWRFDNSITNFGYNYSIVSRSTPNQDTTAGWALAMTDSAVGNNQVSLQMNSAGSKLYDATSSGSSTDVSRTSTITSFTVMEIKRTPANASFYEGGILKTAITTNVTSSSLNATLQSRNTGTMFSTNWLFVRKAVNIEPTTSGYSTSGTSGGTPIVASFTDAPDPSSTGQSVTFTDTSTGSPTTWNWTFGDIGGSNTSTAQNPTHTYSTAGNYTVLFNITNSTGSWSNTSGFHNVTNASSYFPQDVWMEGQYLQTFTITDSTTGMPISVTTLTLSPGGSTFTTTNGTGYLTTGFGIYTVTFVSTGYNGKTISYAFDSDQTHAVQLTPANPGGNQNVWYTPWQVRIRIVDYYGKPLPSTNVTAFYIASTLPNTNTTWLTSAYGISPEVASDMVNSAVAMAGRTDDNGGLSFTMFKSLEYHLEITNTTSGVSATKNLYPSDPEYVIYVQTAGQGVGNNTLGLRNATLPWYSLNSSYISLNMSYIDGTHCTGNVTFRVWFRNNGSELHNTTQSAATGTQITDSHIVLKAPIGTEYLWGYNATTVC